MMNYEERIIKIIKIDLKLQCSLCDNSDAYILVKGTITFVNTVAQGQANNGANKKVILKLFIY